MANDPASLDRRQQCLAAKGMMIEDFQPTETLQ
jgi:hypothetical protein